MADNEKLDVTVGIDVESNANDATKDVEKLTQQLNDLAGAYKKISSSISLLDKKNATFTKQISQIARGIAKLTKQSQTYINTISGENADNVVRSTFRTDKNGNHSFSYNSNNPLETELSKKVIASQSKLDQELIKQKEVAIERQRERNKYTKKIVLNERLMAQASSDEAKAMLYRERERANSGYYQSATRLNQSRADFKNKQTEHYDRELDLKEFNALIVSERENRIKYLADMHELEVREKNATRENIAWIEAETAALQENTKTKNAEARLMAEKNKDLTNYYEAIANHKQSQAIINDLVAKNFNQILRNKNIYAESIAFNTEEKRKHDFYKVKAEGMDERNKKLAYENEHRAELEEKDREIRRLRDEKLQYQKEKQRYLESTGLMEERARRLRYQNDHPELNRPLKFQKRYQVSSGLVNLGSRMESHGSLGFIAGSVSKVIGKSLLSPVAGVVASFASLGEGLVKLGKAAITASSEIEMLRTNLGVVYGSQTQSDTAFNEISEYATKSPFGVQQTTEMAVLLKQSGVYASELMDTLKMIGDTSGGNAEKMKRIANNYAQITSIGKASMLDMRQFAYAGIPIYKEVSKELGVSQVRLRKMISDGKVSSDIIEKVFKNITGVNGVFEKATEKGAKTFKARLQNLKDISQLALAGVGDSLLNIGEKTGGDSYAYGLLNFTESMFEKLKNWRTLKNLEHDVHLIEERDKKSEHLKELIDYASSQGNDDAVKILELELEELKKISSIDSDRALQAALFNRNYTPFKELSDRTGYKTAESMERGLKANLTSSFTKYKTSSTVKEYEVNKALYRAADALYEASKDATKAYRSITKDQAQAALEERILQSQQRALDSIEKNASKAGNYFDIKDKADERYENSDEGKSEIEAEFKKQNEEMAELAKKLMPYVIDKNGEQYVNINGIELDLLKKFEEKGIFRTEKLSLVKDKNDSLENREKLQSNYLDYTRDILKLVEETKYKDSAYEYMKDALSLNIEDSDTFYKKLGTLVESLESFIKGIQISPEQRKLIENRAKFTTLEVTTDTGIKSYVDNEAKKAAKDFIPLWKRILGSSLGIDPKNISTTKGAFDFYNDDLSKRKAVQNTLKSGALAGAVSLSDIQKLTKSVYSTPAKNRGDTSYTYQINWRETYENIKKFALTLRTSSSIIEGYNSSLEEQRETLLKLASSDMFTNETLDVVSAKALNDDILKELAGITNGQSGINAFGEVFKAGEEFVTLKSDGTFVNKKGEEVDKKSVTIEGNLINSLKAALEENTSALVESNEILNRTRLIKSLREKTQSTEFTDKLLAKLKSPEDLLTFNFIKNEDPEYLSNFLNNNIKEQNKGVEDFAIEKFWDNYYDKASEGHSGAIKQVNKALEAFNGELDELNKSSFSDFSDKLKNAAYYTDKFAISVLQAEQKAEGNYNADGSFKWTGEGGFLNIPSDNVIKAYDKKLLEDTGFSTDMEFNDQGKLLDPNGEIALGANGEEIDKSILQLERLKGQLKGFQTQLLALGKDTIEKVLVVPFEELGKQIALSAKGFNEWDHYLENVGTSLQAILEDMMKQIGPAMTNAGFQLIASGDPKSMAIGFGLVAAGGIVKGITSVEDGAEEEKQKNNESFDKMNTLKDQLAELLRQARSDALYYEKNLRHKTALGINKGFSMQSVNDAIITPGGDIISTHPDDYLIATKTPGALAAPQAAQPNVIFKVVNNVGSDVQVKQKTIMNDDGNLEAVAVIERVVGDYIASSKSDAAFGAREARTNGVRVIM